MFIYSCIGLLDTTLPHFTISSNAFISLSKWHPAGPLKTYAVLNSERAWCSFPSSTSRTCQVPTYVSGMHAYVSLLKKTVQPPQSIWNRERTTEMPQVTREPTPFGRTLLKASRKCVPPSVPPPLCWCDIWLILKATSGGTTGYHWCVFLKRSL